MNLIKILIATDVDINAEDDNGNTPLHLAATNSTLNANRDFQLLS